MVWNEKQSLRKRIDAISFITGLVVLISLYAAIYAAKLFGIALPIIG